MTANKDRYSTPVSGCIRSPILRMMRNAVDMNIVDANADRIAPSLRRAFELSPSPSLINEVGLVSNTTPINDKTDAPNCHDEVDSWRTIDPRIVVIKGVKN